MVALALERYQAIMNPFTVRASRNTYKRAVILMFAIWLVSCAIATPQALVVATTDFPPFRYCMEDWSKGGGETGNRVYTIVAFIVLFAIPIVVISVSYAIIIRKLWHPEHELNEQQARGTDDEEKVSHKMTVHGGKKKRKTTYMLLTVIVVFLICMLPFQILILVSNFEDFSRSEAYAISTKISSVLAVCSMACNPFIYSFFSEKFRRAFTDVFKCRCEDDSQQPSTQLSSVVLLSSSILRK